MQPILPGLLHSKDLRLMRELHCCSSTSDHSNAVPSTKASDHNSKVPQYLVVSARLIRKRTPPSEPLPSLCLVVRNLSRTDRQSWDHGMTTPQVLFMIVTLWVDNDNQMTYTDLSPSLLVKNTAEEASATQPLQWKADLQSRMNHIMNYNCGKLLQKVRPYFSLDCLLSTMYLV